MTAPTAYWRDVETRRRAAGVRTDPTHWASAVVHAHHKWLTESTLLTWCGIEVDVAEKGRQTTDTISCLQCGESSWKALREAL